jgi:two-component system, sensor histidine kinase LadS
VSPGRPACTAPSSLLACAVGWFRIWLLSACLLSASAAVALELPALPLDGSGHQYLTGHYAVLPDFDNRYALHDVMAADAPFQLPKSSSPSFGYHPGKLWVRLRIVNPLMVRQIVWLESNWPFKDWVDVYQIRAGGEMSHQLSGQAVPIAERPIASRYILFPLNLAPGERVDIYIALSGRAASNINLNIWQPAAFADARALRNAIRYLFLGLVFLVIVFSVLAAQARRQPLLILGGVGDALLVPLFFGLDGFFVDILPAGPEIYHTRTVNLLMACLFFTHVQFARVFLDLKRLSPRLDRLAFWLAIGFLLVNLYAALANVPQYAAFPAFCLFVFMTGVAIYARRFGGPEVKIYMWSWGMLWAAAAIRIAQQLGWLQGSQQLYDLPMLAVFSSALVLTYCFYLVVRNARLEAEATQARLAEQQASENIRLQRAVEEKTHALRAATEAAEKSSQTKSGFLSMMSHELRAPLHTVLGYSQLLARDAPPAMQGKLDVIEQSGQQLLRLINQVLEFSRGESAGIDLAPQSVDLRQLASQVLSSNLLLAQQRGNTLDLVLDAKLPAWVEVDDQRLTQILQNLIGNACKYTENGKITLRVNLLERELDPATRQRHYRIGFVVSDTGPGIPPAAIGSIFEPFTRLDPGHRQPGVGLGLAIVKQLVGAMDGQIRVDSHFLPESPTGTVFSLELRLPEAEHSELPALAAPLIIGHQGPQRRLLVIDDIPENRRYLRELCERWGFHTELAADGAEALALLRGGLVVDAVLVDQFMPVLDGWGFLQQLRADTSLRQIPVLLVTAAEPVQPADFPANVAFDAILMKPLDIDRLASILQTLLGLVWICRDLDPPPEQPVCNLDSLLAEELASFRAMVGLGQVVAIQQWARQMIEIHPQCAAALLHISELCEKVDLGALKRISEGIGK